MAPRTNKMATRTRPRASPYGLSKTQSKRGTLSDKVVDNMYAREIRFVDSQGRNTLNWTIYIANSVPCSKL